MQERIDSCGFPWQMRVGIATGEPIIGLIGYKRQSYTALGDTVNLASRIEELCVPGRVTIDHATYSEVQRYVDVRPVHTSGTQDTSKARLLGEARKQASNVDGQTPDASALKRVGLLLLHAGDPSEKIKNEPASRIKPATDLRASIINGL